MDNEDGLAYGYMMICLYLGAGVFIWMTWAYVFNIFLTTTINPAITEVSGFRLISCETKKANAIEPAESADHKTFCEIEKMVT